MHVFEKGPKNLEMHVFDKLLLKMHIFFRSTNFEGRLLGGLSLLDFQLFY